MHWAITLCFICATINLSECVLCEVNGTLVEMDVPPPKRKAPKKVGSTTEFSWFQWSKDNKQNILIGLEIKSLFILEMEDALKNILKVNVKKSNRPSSAGCINRGKVYETEDNRLLFVKKNSKFGSNIMFNGELEGLKAIHSTKTVLVPFPVATGCINGNEQFIVMEYFKMNALIPIYASELGSQLADMHLHNLLGKQSIKQFGFHVETCCGFIPQNNTWTDDWITFFTENRLAHQIQLLQSSSGSKTLKKKVIENYWPRLKPKIPKFFEGIDVKPSLLHGDLWTGNAAETNSKPVIFDPAAFYGHHEYDIACTYLFGGFADGFYDAYFKKIPKANGFRNRIMLYHLFHYLNHWNHFGGSYIETTMETFEHLLNLF